VLDPDDRIGTERHGGYPSMRQHPFWEGLPAPWETLHSCEPPQLDAFLPAMADDETEVHGRDAADEDIDALLAKATRSGSVMIRKQKKDEKEKLLAKQKAESPWHGRECSSRASPLSPPLPVVCFVPLHSCCAASS
jgi:hypothetical protein